MLGTERDSVEGKEGTSYRTNQPAELLFRGKLDSRREGSRPSLGVECRGPRKREKQGREDVAQRQGPAPGIRDHCFPLACAKRLENNYFPL